MWKFWRDSLITLLFLPLVILAIRIVDNMGFTVFLCIIWITLLILVVWEIVDYFKHR